RSYPVQRGQRHRLQVAREYPQPRATAVQLADRFRRPRRRLHLAGQAQLDVVETGIELVALGNRQTPQMLENILLGGDAQLPADRREVMLGDGQGSVQIEKPARQREL